MGCQLFGWFLPKFDGPKIPSSLIGVYSNFPMPTTRFFQFIPIFDVVSFSKEPYQKHFCESSLFFEFSFFSEFPFCSKSSLHSSPFDGSLQSFGSFSQISLGLKLSMFTKMGFGSNLLMLTSNLVLLGRQYYILYKPNHHFLNFLVCFFIPSGNWRTIPPIKKILILWFCWTHNTMFHCLVLVHSITSW